MIRVENLTFEYPGTRALDNLSFTIPAGSITALVGPNGAGKTTLLQCMAALQEPFGGRIFLEERDIFASPRDIHRLLGYLPDFFGLYEKLSVTQTLTYFAMAQKVERSAIADRVRRVIARLNLENKATDKVAGLSRGLRQRLAIGQALIHDPKILLLDEPASGLDPEARQALAELFVELNADGKTLIVSSHILSELDQYANHLLILKDGRLVDQDIDLSGAPATRRIHIELVAETTDLESALAHDEQVSRIDSRGTLTAFDFRGDDRAQHHLLKKLVEHGIPVKALYLKREGVQEQYLKTMAADVAGETSPTPAATE